MNKNAMGLINPAKSFATESVGCARVEPPCIETILKRMTSQLQEAKNDNQILRSMKSKLSDQLNGPAPQPVGAADAHPQPMQSDLIHLTDALEFEARDRRDLLADIGRMMIGEPL